MAESSAATCTNSRAQSSHLLGRPKPRATFGLRCWPGRTCELPSPAFIAVSARHGRRVAGVRAALCAHATVHPCREGLFRSVCFRRRIDFISSIHGWLRLKIRQIRQHQLPRRIFSLSQGAAHPPGAPPIVNLRRGARTRRTPPAPRPPRARCSKRGRRKAGPRGAAPRAGAPAIKMRAR